MPADLERLLAQNTGLRLGEGNRTKVEELLRQRAGRHRSSLAGYCAGLSHQALARELESLAADVTPGETFFFRDHGQFDLLRFHLLPELIARRGKQRTLRLWSAGCASGEEAYSLAMLMDMVLPKRQGWQITLLGSDINDGALAKARRGRYGAWSFRGVPANLREGYFRPEGDDWVVNEDIRAMVTFRSGNLVTGPLPDMLFREMDLILCRNVLIYFSPEAVCTVAAKLSACLGEGGYLLTGHTELMGCPVPDLRGRLFPEGVVYQRKDLPLTGSEPTTPTPRTLSSLPQPRTPVASTRPLAAGGARKAAALSVQAPRPDEILDTARTLADRGDYPAAEAVCRRALDVDPLEPASHFLLAQLAQLRGDYGEAEVQLNRTLYLAPYNVAAYLELAALHERSGDIERALARRRAALDILRKLPADARVEPFETSAGQLAEWLIKTEPL